MNQFLSSFNLLPSSLFLFPRPSTFIPVTHPPPADPILSVDRLGKKFKIYPNPWARAAEWLTFSRSKRHEDFWALRDVSFALTKGESLGVIGVNGSGKSTLLKILSGALYPTEGNFALRGRVLSLLELGTGVNQQLTGRQNVITSSRLLDFPQGYAESKMTEIEQFADLPAGFFERPVSMYSSGMLVRLVFSMFACFEPDVFIVDEALSVGDVFFQQKCARRLQEMRRGGTTMLFVSHDLAAVEALCDRVLVLHQGTARHLGEKLAGIRMYYALSGAQDPRSQQNAQAPRAVDDAGMRVRAGNEIGESFSTEDLAWQPPADAGALSGDGRIRVTGIAFSRDDGAQVPVVEQGHWLTIFVRYEATTDVYPVNCGFDFSDRFDRLLFARGFVNSGIEPLQLQAGESFIARYRVNLDLEPGEYVLTVTAAEPFRDETSPTGWDQNVGGARYAVLKGVAKVAVLPRADRVRTHYGPSPLRSEVSVQIERMKDEASVADEKAEVSP
jgi:ABC-type polysaccharide/polyol phosphate transport system ATPase subunit